MDLKVTEPDDIDIQDMKEQDRIERWHQKRLNAHPDCRDPDHPGCDACIADDEDD